MKTDRGETPPPRFAERRVRLDDENGSLRRRSDAVFLARGSHLFSLEPDAGRAITWRGAQ
jgi:hypothetical protein